MSFKKHIPNAITCANLFCGCLAIIKALDGDLSWAAYLVGIAAVLDFFDGFAARMLKVQSPIGKDLDSLADMVTFGVVPGMVMFKLMAWGVFVRTLVDGPATSGWTIYPPLSALPEMPPSLETVGHNPYLNYFALLIPVFSCIRLAKFNNDTRQSDSFIGLPTPANAIFICSLPLVLVHQFVWYPAFLFNIYLLCGLALLMSFLLVAPIPLFSLKFKKFNWADNGLRYIFLTISLLFLILFHYVGIPLTIIFYVLLSIVNNIFLKKEV